MFNNAISIPVADDQPDEFGGRLRSRPRRKRRKSEFRGKNELANRTCKQLTRWVLVLVAAVLLLIFETWKLGWKSSTVKSELGVHDKKPNVVVSSAKKPEGT